MHCRLLHIVSLAACLAIPAAGQIGTGGLDIGAEGLLTFPVGGLSDRFTRGSGGAIMVRDAAGSGARWGVRLELVRFLPEDQTALSVERKKDIGAGPQDVTVPVRGLSMELRSVGLLVTATHTVLEGSVIGLDLGYGFGFYRWQYDRSGFGDTLRVDSAGVRVPVEIVQVPPLSQQDWSGGFEAGFDVKVELIEPLWLSVSGRYRLIVGELWPTLDLDLENVSGLHMLDVRLGIHARL